MKSQVNHGKNMKDVEIISDNLVAKRKGENFGRIKVSTLAKFLGEQTNEESVFGLVQQAPDEISQSENFALNKENNANKFETMSVTS